MTIKKDLTPYPKQFLFALHLLLTFFCMSPLQASLLEDLCCGHQLFVQPDLYYIKRTRDGGSHQKGLLHGVKFGYNRLVCDGFYWELNSSFGEGRIKGRNGLGDTLNSRLSDMNAEGRFGYSILFKKLFCLSFTPYIGYGYFQQTNHFLDPSPLTIKFRDSFHFASTGFLSEFLYLHPFSVGLDFEAKFMIDGKSKVTDDPDPTIDSMFLAIGNKTHYQVELPITYVWCCTQRKWHVGLVPFYQLRQYGGHENYPFDFLRTNYEVYGARLAFDWQF